MNNNLTKFGISDEWVDKLFNCMELFYTDRWSRMVSGLPIDQVKTIWKHALIGLDYDMIKQGLVKCKQDAGKGYLPPSPMEFFRIAKSTCKPKDESV